MNKIFISALFFIILTADYHSCRTLDEEFSFIVAADMRSSALPQFRDASHFQGACEAMKKVGPGAFMISPGDIDPPGAVREVISEVLGDDFPWYPVVGNHELEADSPEVARGSLVDVVPGVLGKSGRPEIGRSQA